MRLAALQRRLQTRRRALTACLARMARYDSQLARGESASVLVRLGAAIQKVLRVGFLTHQVMVGFGMRVGANNAEYFLQNFPVSQTNAGHGFSMC